MLIRVILEMYANEKRTVTGSAGTGSAVTSGVLAGGVNPNKSARILSSHCPARMRSISLTSCLHHPSEHIREARVFNLLELGFFFAEELLYLANARCIVNLRELLDHRR